MKKSFHPIPGAVVAPKGFQAAGVFCDIKRLGTGKGSSKGRKNDLALIVSDPPATAAGMFTTNQVCAAPVKISIPRANSTQIRAIVINSGNANTCTGPQGLKDAATMTRTAAQLLNCREEQVLVASTGRIGVALPMAHVKKGIHLAVQQLNPTRQNAHQAALAILTSDSKPKEIAVEFLLNGQTVRIGGICKGAGMIHPGMSPSGRRPPSTPHALHATMLAFLTTDIAAEQNTLQRCLEKAVAQSFNRITVDGDMSTNDTVLLLANGEARTAVLHEKSGIHLKRFQEALNHVTLELAKMIVLDGEGVSRFVTVHVQGARNAGEADAAARAVANSALVKTSWCGGDPNWGRILDALGYSNAKILEEKIDVAYAKPGSRSLTYSLKRGQPTRTPISKLRKITSQPAFDLYIHLNQGKGSALMYASDLTEAYVDFNKGE